MFRHFPSLQPSLFFCQFPNILFRLLLLIVALLIFFETYLSSSNSSVGLFSSSFHSSSPRMPSALTIASFHQFSCFSSTFFVTSPRFSWYRIFALLFASSLAYPLQLLPLLHLFIHFSPSPCILFRSTRFPISLTLLFCLTCQLPFASSPIHSEPFFFFNFSASHSHPKHRKFSPTMPSFPPRMTSSTR